MDDHYWSNRVIDAYINNAHLSFDETFKQMANVLIEYNRAKKFAIGFELLKQGKLFERQPPTERQPTVLDQLERIVLVDELQAEANCSGPPSPSGDPRLPNIAELPHHPWKGFTTTVDTQVNGKPFDPSELFAMVEISAPTGKVFTTKLVDDIPTLCPACHPNKDIT